jgi:hypothetical protein
MAGTLTSLRTISQLQEPIGLTVRLAQIPMSYNKSKHCIVRSLYSFGRGHSLVLVKTLLLKHLITINVAHLSRTKRTEAPATQQKIAKAKRRFRGEAFSVPGARADRYGKGKLIDCGIPDPEGESAV